MGEKKQSKLCRRCDEHFDWSDKDFWWDYRGYTPTKLVKCPFCSTVQAVDYEPEQNVNFDMRYYKYK